MNNSTVDTAALVQQLNDEKVKVLLPVIVYIAVLMVLGLVGNLMVCFYYVFKTKIVPTSIFIVAVAIYDLIFCFIGMPSEISIVARFYTYESGAACKILVFISHTASVASALTLVIIAVDRFKLIRRSTKKQTTVKDAKKNCLIVAGVAVLLSSLIFVLSDAEQVPIPNDFGLELHGYECAFVKDESYKPVVWTCAIIVVLAIIVFTIILIVLYSMVVWTIRKHKDKLAKYQQDISHTSEIQMSSMDSDTKEDDSKVRQREDNTTAETRETICQNTQDTQNQNESILNQETGDGTELTGASSTKKESKAVKVKPQEMMIAKADEKVDVKPTSVATKYKQTIKITIVMIIISFVFVISFLPYLSVIIWKSVTGVQKGELSNSKLIGTEIVFRSFLLNSVTNPWIYGICNSGFRMYYYNLLCCKN